MDEDTPRTTRREEQETNRIINFLTKMSTIECIRYLTVLFLCLKVFSIIFNVGVLSYTYSIASKTNLRLFLSVFTLMTLVQSIVFYIKNRQYFTVNRLNDVQDTNEIGLLGNFVDAFILFWCLTGYHWISECKTCKEYNPILYFTSLTWSLLGIFMVLSPLVAIILLLIVVTYFKPRLPVVTYKNGEELKGADEICSICLNSYVLDDEVKILPCNHNYHKNCIEDWFNVDDICPTCRKPVNILFDLVDQE